MTVKDFIDSLSKEERESFFRCIQKVFEDDARQFARMPVKKLESASAIRKAVP